MKYQNRGHLGTYDEDWQADSFCPGIIAFLIPIAAAGKIRDLTMKSFDQPPRRCYIHRLLNVVEF